MSGGSKMTEEQKIKMKKKRNDKLHIPISSEDKSRLRENAERCGLSLTAYCLKSNDKISECLIFAGDDSFLQKICNLEENETIPFK
jgi:hypothetical protein